MSKISLKKLTAGGCLSMTLCLTVGSGVDALAADKTAANIADAGGGYGTEASDIVIFEDAANDSAASKYIDANDNAPEEYTDTDSGDANDEPDMSLGISDGDIPVAFDADEEAAKAVKKCIIKANDFVYDLANGAITASVVKTYSSLKVYDKNKKRISNDQVEVSEEDLENLNSLSAGDKDFVVVTAPDGVEKLICVSLTDTTKTRKIIFNRLRQLFTDMFCIR